MKWRDPQTNESRRWAFFPGHCHVAIELAVSERFTLSFRDVEDLLAERGIWSPTKPYAAG